MKLVVLLVAFLSLVTGILSLATGGENFNSIYLGDFPVDGIGPITVQIKDDGSVLVFKGRLVPGMHDRFGKEVVIKRVCISEEGKVRCL
jgi:hypothetical protein